MKIRGRKPNMKFWRCSCLNFHVNFTQAGLKNQFKLVTSISTLISPKLTSYKGIHGGYKCYTPHFQHGFLGAHLAGRFFLPTLGRPLFPEVVQTDGGQSTLRLPPCGLFLGKIWVGWIEIYGVYTRMYSVSNIFMFTPNWEFDCYFPNGLKPPTSY